MNDRKLSALARLLLGEGADQTASHLLALAVASSAARVGALYVVADGELRLVKNHNLDHDAQKMAQAMWAESGGRLATHDLVHRVSEDKVLHAVLFAIKKGIELVAVVYLDSVVPDFPSMIDREGLRRSAPTFLEAIAAPRAPAIAPAIVLKTHLQDLERDHLLIVLQHNEWNLARVARILGISRPTLYRLLREFAIRRERVVKTPRRRSPAARTEQA